MNKLLNLSEVPTPQLRAIRQILTAGVPAKSEKTEYSQDGALCHKSPPKGYPEDKSEYGDPECYRYPLNTRKRCLAAWRYVHQERNKDVLGGKWSKVVSKIKSYAKRHYDLDLEAGESEVFDWEQAFTEYYDAETAGDGYIEPEAVSDDVRGKDNMDDKEKITSLETELANIKTERDNVQTELDGKASELETLTNELNGMKEELESLREFKKTTEEAAERAEKLKGIKAKLDEAEIENNLEDESEAEYWLGMTDEVLEKTIAMMSNLKKKGAEASASTKMKVPPVGGSDDESDAVSTVRETLKARKNKSD